jgi:hypothetical protein
MKKRSLSSYIPAYLACSALCGIVPAVIAYFAVLTLSHDKEYALTIGGVILLFVTVAAFFVTLIFVGGASIEKP